MSVSVCHSDDEKSVPKNGPTGGGGGGGRSFLSELLKKTETRKEDAVVVDNWRKSGINLFDEQPMKFPQARKCSFCGKWAETEKLKNMHRTIHPSKIIDGLYLGDATNASSKDELLSLGVTHVLNVAYDCEPFHNDVFRYLHLNLSDNAGQEIRSYFDEAFQFIDEAVSQQSSDAGSDGGGAVFVHCQKGVSRSASFVIGYLMSRNGWELLKTMQYVREQRSIVYPNFGFVKQLFALHEELHPQSELELKEILRKCDYFVNK